MLSEANLDVGQQTVNAWSALQTLNSIIEDLHRSDYIYAFCRRQ